MSEITQEDVKERFEYRESGGLYYRHSVSNNTKKGLRFGCVSQDYRIGRFRDRGVLEHRLIFLYHYGYMPTEIDHADGNTTNNRIDNLREASRGQNGMNRKKQNGNYTSKFKGVYKDNDFRRNPWRARIHIDGKMKSLGSFSTEIEAACAYNEAASKLFGEFALLNEATK